MDDFRSFEILLVEDNPADARQITDYFNESRVDIKIEHVSDGTEALDYLCKKGIYESASLPDIIILDMNLPKIGGMKVLKVMNDNHNLKKIPVIIFGTSGDPLEVKKAYNNYANCYIVKALDLDHLNNILKSIEEFWLKTVTLPTKL